MVATLRRRGNAFTYFPTFVYIVEYVLEPSKHRVSILPIFILFRQREETFQKQSTSFLDRPRSSEIFPMLALIYNESLAQGTVPDDWRQANVAPVFKPPVAC